MPTDNDSTRLRDRAQTAFQRRRQQATETSTRLRDRSQTLFQRQREQVDETREAISEGRKQFAGALNLDAGAVEAVQLDDRGTQFGFVPNKSGREALAKSFADGREFVDPDDAVVEADPRGEVTTRTDPERVEEIATEARRQTAADDQFAEPDDLRAEVGPGGVSEIGFTERGERRRSARALEADTPLSDVDPSADLEQTDSGFGLDASAQRRSAARGFEDRVDAFEQGALDPQDDVRPAGDAFGLSRGRAREAAVDRLDEQLPDVAVGPDDINLKRGPGGEFDASLDVGGGQ